MAVFDIGETEQSMLADHDQALIFLNHVTVSFASLSKSDNGESMKNTALSN